MNDHCGSATDGQAQDCSKLHRLTAVDSRHSRLISFTVKQNLYDFRYEGGAPINSGFQIPVVNEKREYGPSQQARAI